jgi:hypothetical protein
MASSDNGAIRPATADARPSVIGAYVRVVARRGYIVEGLCLDAWRLRNGGVALKVKPSDGGAPREVTTLGPVVVLPDSVADSG